MILARTLRTAPGGGRGLATAKATPHDARINHDKLPPVSRRLDYALQALEDICSKLDTITQSLAQLEASSSEPPSLAGLMNRKNAAAALGVSERSIQNLVATGELPCVRVGRTVRFAQMDLERFIARHRRDWGSSRWRGKGAPRIAGWEHADDAYLERLTRPDPAEKMRPLDDDFRDALKAHRVTYNGQRALRLAGICSTAEAKTYSHDELLRVQGIGHCLAPRVLRAVGKRG